MAIWVVNSPLLLRSGDWTDDGLGGIYNKDGWTGRRTESDQLRIFKAHLIQVGQGGGTPLCPFESWRPGGFGLFLLLKVRDHVVKDRRPANLYLFVC